jgi:hypothetical protein
MKPNYRPRKITVLQRLKYRRLSFDPFDLSAIGCMASAQYRQESGRAPFKIRQRETAGSFMVAAYPTGFLPTIDRITDLFMSLDEEQRKEIMKKVMNYELGPLSYLEANVTLKPRPASNNSSPRRRRRRRIAPDGGELAYTTRREERDRRSSEEE